MVVGQVFSKYLDFPCYFSFHRLPRIHDSPHRRRCVVVKLTALLNKKLKESGRQLRRVQESANERAISVK
jgi:hypothetical protein